jgi:hypothetical protein
MLNVPVSYGEYLDKLSILQLKTERLSDTRKKAAEIEYKELKRCMPMHLERPLAQQRYAELLYINSLLWDLETDIRAALAELKVDIVAVQLTQIHEFNKARHEKKQEIDRQHGSMLSEQKDYTVK